METLDFNRVRLAIDTANKEVALTYAEIVSLKSAIGYALVEFIYVLSKRLLHFNRMRTLGNHRYVYKRFLKSDIYLHFALNGPVSNIIVSELEKLGILQENISLNYAKSVVETTRMAKFLFDGIRNIGSIMSGEDTLSLLTIHRILCAQGTYKNMSYETRDLVLSYIAEIGERINISEPLIASKLINFASYNDMDICTILFDYRKNLERYIKDNYYLRKVKERKSVTKQYIYILFILAVALGLSIGSYFLFYSIALSVLLFVPFLLLSQGFIHFMLQIAVPTRPLPQMDYKSVPAEHATLVAVSEFITNMDQMKQAIRNIKVLRAGNPDKNIFIALLADLKSSDSLEDDNDSALLAIAKEVEKEENLIVFVRKRTRIGKRYQAYERKRGAVMALVRLLVTGNRDDFTYISAYHIPNFEYVVALDADNKVPVGGIKEMVNIIAHPANKKFDLIAARSKYNLYSIHTPFSKRFIKESAFVHYPNYSSLFYSCFGMDIFCGKGIFRLKSFYNKLDGIFPENKLLSHDILEGAVLSTASGFVVYEDAPKNFVSDRERKKRWQRGDIQFLPFLGKYWKNRDGEHYDSDIAPVYKFLMASNFLSILSPILLLIAGIFTIILTRLWPLFLFSALAPFALELLAVIRNAIIQRYRPIYLLSDVVTGILDFVIELGLLPYYAYSNTKVLATTLWKMATKGNLLEWKTYYQSQTQGGKFTKEIAPSMVILPIAGIALATSGIFSLPLLLFAAFTYLVNLGIYLSGFRIPKKRKHIDTILNYAEKTYAYFKYMRKENGLISDNLQIKPYKGMSLTTSPTNLGMQMIAEISACLLGLVSESATIATLEHLIDFIDNLKKWKGNLYNWYRAEDQTVSVEFVSSIDSGNLIAALITVKGFLKEKRGSKELLERIEKLINNTNLGALYDRNKKLFFIGYN
ncbi:MAG: hypothetical protein PHI19_08125, partial [Clostridia bacterium]|nr:hypothetical protein [Clostridia bacterium]